MNCPLPTSDEQISVLHLGSWLKMISWFMLSRTDKVRLLSAWSLNTTLCFQALIDPYSSSTHEEATVALLFWTNPHPLRSWPFSKFYGWRLTSSHVNLLLVRSHQAEIIIEKRLIQGRKHMTTVRAEPTLCSRGHRKNDAFAFSATLPTLLVSCKNRPQNANFPMVPWFSMVIFSIC